MRNSRGRLARLARIAPLAAVLPLAACEWFTDFKQTPSVKTWQHFSSDSAAGRGFRGQPAGSVATTGTAMPGFVVSYSNSPATIDSFSVLRNPAVPDARSLHNGRLYYQINCAVCHGDTGDGNGGLKQASPMYGFSPSLLTDQAKARSDGYLWGMVRNGRGIMPSYNRIEEADRWDVVNYIRGLQGSLGAPVATGPLGQPGETGEKLPGVTPLGPTVPAKYAKPGIRPTGVRSPEEHR